MELLVDPLTGLNETEFVTQEGDEVLNSLRLTSREDCGINAGALIVDGSINIKLNACINGIVKSKEYVSLSDERLKYDIKKLKNPLTKLKKIIPCSYKWKDTKAKQYGVIAQQLERQGFNHLIYEENETKSVNYLQIIPILIGSIQELSKEVNALKKQLKQ